MKPVCTFCDAELAPERADHVPRPYEPPPPLTPERERAALELRRAGLPWGRIALRLGWLSEESAKAAAGRAIDREQLPAARYRL